MFLNVHWRIPFLNPKFFINTCSPRVESPSNLLLNTSAGISNGSLIDIVVEKLYWFLRSSRRKNSKRNGRGGKGKYCNVEDIWSEKIIAGVMWCVYFNLSWCILCVVLELCGCAMGKVVQLSRWHALRASWIVWNRSKESKIVSVFLLFELVSFQNWVVISFSDGLVNVRCDMQNTFCIGVLLFFYCWSRSVYVCIFKTPYPRAEKFLYLKL